MPTINRNSLPRIGGASGVSAEPRINFGNLPRKSSDQQMIEPQINMPNMDFGSNRLNAAQKAKDEQSKLQQNNEKKQQ